MVVGWWWQSKSLFKMGLKMGQVYPLRLFFPLTRPLVTSESLYLEEMKTWQLEDIFCSCRCNHWIHWFNLKAHMCYLKLHIETTLYSYSVLGFNFWKKRIFFFSPPPPGNKDGRICRSFYSCSGCNGKYSQMWASQKLKEEQIQILKGDPGLTQNLLHFFRFSGILGPMGSMSTENRRTQKHAANDSLQQELPAVVDG